MDWGTKEQRQFFEKTFYLILVTWKKKLGLVKLFPYISLSFQTTEEKQYRGSKNMVLPNYLEMIIPGKT